MLTVWDTIDLPHNPPVRAVVDDIAVGHLVASGTYLSRPKNALLLGFGACRPAAIRPGMWRRRPAPGGRRRGDAESRESRCTASRIPNPIKPGLSTTRSCVDTFLEFVSKDGPC